MIENQYVLAAIINIAAAALFILLAGLIREPFRQRAMVIVLAYAAGVFLNDPFAPYGLIVSLLVALLAGLGLTNYRWIALDWVIHSAWDTCLHMEGHGVAGLDPMTSFACAVVDPIIALWLWFGAPSVLNRIGLLSPKKGSSM